MHSALRRAIEKGNLPAVQAALAHGANIEEPDMHGDPGHPLRIACFHGHVDIVRTLIHRGADIHAPNAQGPGGPIRMAVRGKHRPIIELLIAHGAEVPPDLPLPDFDAAERRRQPDRRRRNAGPPKGLHDRRLSRDRRATHVQEIDLDTLQWERYFAQTQPNPLHMFDHDADETPVFVFDRVRD